MRRPTGDAGSIAPLVPVFAFVLLLLGGLIVDASRLLNARGRAVAFAEEAARAGASAIEQGRAELRIDESTMRARVKQYCDAVMADPSGGVWFCEFDSLSEVGDGDSRRLVVAVKVRLRIPASLLGMIGVDELNASAFGSARPFEGVDPRDLDSSPPPVDVFVPENPPGPPPEVDVDVDLPLPSPSPLPSVLPSIEVSIPPIQVSIPPILPSPAATP